VLAVLDEGVEHGVPLVVLRAERVERLGSKACTPNPSDGGSPPTVPRPPGFWRAAALRLQSTHAPRIEPALACQMRCAACSRVLQCTQPRRS
jgi:hypothetical protein